jgi:hypothetical protein
MPDIERRSDPEDDVVPPEPVGPMKVAAERKKHRANSEAGCGETHAGICPATFVGIRD